MERLAAVALERDCSTEGNEQLTDLEFLFRNS